MALPLNTLQAMTTFVQSRTPTNIAFLADALSAILLGGSPDRFKKGFDKSLIKPGEMSANGLYLREVITYAVANHGVYGPGTPINTTAKEIATAAQFEMGTAVSAQGISFVEKLLNSGGDAKLMDEVQAKYQSMLEGIRDQLRDMLYEYADTVRTYPTYTHFPSIYSMFGVKSGVNQFDASSVAYGNLKQSDLPNWKPNVLVSADYTTAVTGCGTNIIGYPMLQLIFRTPAIGVDIQNSIDVILMGQNYFDSLGNQIQNNIYYSPGDQDMANMGFRNFRVEGFRRVFISESMHNTSGVSGVKDIVALNTNYLKLKTHPDAALKVNGWDKVSNEDPESVVASLIWNLTLSCKHRKAHVLATGALPR